LRETRLSLSKRENSLARPLSHLDKKGREKNHNEEFVTKPSSILQKSYQEHAKTKIALRKMET